MVLLRFHHPTVTLLFQVISSDCQDLYVFISETKKFTDFDNHEALIWRKNNLVYGDWYSGPNGDGTFTLKSQIRASQVSGNMSFE